MPSAAAAFREPSTKLPQGLPVFGAYAGGLNVRDAAFGDLFGAGEMTAWVLGETAVYAIPSIGLRPD
ncbi:hypothetical protein ACIKTA_07840 [Hansschlegelia beijingensis]